jgi:hypothetical protein
MLVLFGGVPKIKVKVGYRCISGLANGFNVLDD